MSRTGLGSTPAPCENKFPHLEHPNYLCIFGFRAFFFFLLNPCGLKNRYRSSRTEAKVHLYFSSFSAVGKVPGDSAESPDPRVFQSSEVNDPPQRKATASKHSRFTLVCFAPFVGRKCGSGEGDVFLALCLAFLT